MPFVGNMWGVWKRVGCNFINKILLILKLVIKLQNFIDHDLELVQKYGRVTGTFDGNLPNLLITDADFVRAVMIKDFSHFINRRVLAAHCTEVEQFNFMQIHFILCETERLLTSAQNTFEKSSA